jgi:hypothetical protein
LSDLFQVYPHCNSFLFELLSSSSILSVRSAIVLADVYGKEENNEKTKALLSSNPDILPLLINIMDAVMNWDVNREETKEAIKKGFRYGLFQLSVVAIALRNLSISDEIMIKYPKLISLACQGISLFVNDAPDCKGMSPEQTFYCQGGGGGKDLITVENLIELLLQLSFVFEDERSLKLIYVTSSYDLKKAMDDLLTLPVERQLSFEIRQFALQLCSKLDSSEKKVELKAAAVLGQHIMLSYSWLANKDLVVAFGNKLK